MSETILVIGASSDLGGEIIRQVAAEGSLILAHYHQSSAKIEALKRDLPGRDIVPIRVDLAQLADVEQLITTIRDERKTPPDKIVHLAAPKLEYIRFKDLSWEAVEQGLHVQLRSLFRILQEFLPGMAKKKKGKVVVILSSVTMNIPPAALAHYVTTKFALLGLVRALAAEYGPKQININAVSPSMVETAFLEKLPERMVEIAAAQMPFQRHATARDVAGAVRFLLSADADYITGANIPVSGGTAF